MGAFFQELTPEIKVTVDENSERHSMTTTYMSQCQNSSKFLSVSYLMKTADVIMNFFSSHNTTDHT